MDNDAGTLNEIYLTGLLEPSEVHLAMGMVSEQLHLTIVDALAVMRCHADLWDTTLTDVAYSILGRRLHFDS